jgi:DNA-binding CsgD family transcriptional regulator
LLVAGLVVGRETELAEVEGFLDSIEEGFAALVLEGEPGIGKTTVWEEAVSRARQRGYRTLVSRPAQAEAKLSFAALTDLLEPVEPGAFDALPEPQRHALEAALLRVSGEGSRPQPRAAAAGLRSILIGLAGESPVLLAIDDAQWLDAASARALAFALRRLGGGRVGALVTRRPDIDAFRDLVEIPPARLVELDALSLAAIHEVLKRRLGRSLPRPLLVRLFQTCGGNPLFALEIAREIGQAGIGPADPLPVPRDLRRLVRRRLGRLSPAAQEALLAAAALGEPTVPLVAAAVEADPAGALDEAEQAEVVQLDGERIRFVHPLYSAAISAAAPRESRRRVHRRLSELAPDVEERARHLALAAESPSGEVAAVLEQAARQARARGDAATVAALFAEASRLTPPGEEGKAQVRALQAAEAHLDSADTAAARALAEQLVASMPAGPERARAWLLMAVLDAYEHGPVPAKEACLRAMEDAGEDLLLQAEANVRLSLVCIDDFDLARRSTARAVELLRSARDAPDDLVACALLDDAYIRFLTGGGIDRAQAAEAERVMPVDEHTWAAERAHSVRYEWAKYTDDVVRARDLLHETAARRRATGDEYGLAMADHHLAEVECWLGNLSRAREHAEAGRRVIEQAGHPLGRAVTLGDRALVAAYLGEEPEAREAGVAGLELAVQGQDPWLAASLLSTLGFLELSLDDFEAADRWLTRADSSVESVGLAEPARFHFHGDHIEAVLGLGDVDRARELLARLERRAEMASRPWIRVMCSRSEALLHASCGELDLALGAVEAALREHEELEMPLERARTLLCLGRVQRRRKQRKAAREALAQALETFERLGTGLWADKARRELERTHLREAPAELTPSEGQVAQLAASGLKNREIAERLFVSPKTVEANLGRAYRKLGIRSRAELGAALAASEPRRVRRETPDYSARAGS